MLAAASKCGLKSMMTVTSMSLYALEGEHTRLYCKSRQAAGAGPTPGVQPHATRLPRNTSRRMRAQNRITKLRGLGCTLVFDKEKAGLVGGGDYFEGWRGSCKGEVDEGGGGILQQLHAAGVRLQDETLWVMAGK